MQIVSKGKQFAWNIKSYLRKKKRKKKLKKKNMVTMSSAEIFNPPCYALSCSNKTLTMFII